MLTRLSESKTDPTAIPTDGRPWSYEEMEALLQLLVKMRPSVSIITPQEDGSYWCDLASVFNTVKRGRSIQVTKVSGEYHTGMLRNAYWVRNFAENGVMLGMDLEDAYSIDHPIIKAEIILSPQTLVEVKYGDWAAPMRFNKDQIAEAVRLFSQEQPEEAWPSKGTSDPNSWWSSASSGAVSSGPYYNPFVVMPKPAPEPAVTGASSSGTFMGIGVKTVIKDGMIPPSVYKGPPAEPKPKKKWWRRYAGKTE